MGERVVQVILSTALGTVSGCLLKRSLWLELLKLRELGELVLTDEVVGGVGLAALGFGTLVSLVSGCLIGVWYGGFRVLKRVSEGEFVLKYFVFIGKRKKKRFFN